jgi:pimeloyl-ACP methyl ester carboxylesterase
MRHLLESTNPDLADIGLYILSYRPVSRELVSLVGNEVAKETMSRFLVAEFGPDEVDALLNEEAPELRQSLESRLDAVITASTQTAGGEPQDTLVADMTIIIHGTGARSARWWQHGSGFWNYINGVVGNVYGGSDAFSWSGRNRHSARQTAATDLANWALAHPATNLDIIAHSHGGNVALLASHEGLEIRKLINLGTPIRTEYLPSLHNIETLHNVFSTRDFVQTPAGTIPNRRGEGRTLADSERIINHRATDDGTGSSPGHSELHETSTWQASYLEQLL